MNTQVQSFTQFLQRLVSSTDSKLEKAVAQIILNDNEPEQYIHDVLQYGCQSGFVTELIYYSDTHAFYDEHYGEIEDLRCEWEDILGTPLKVKHDLKNFFAWFAFEETTRKIHDSFESFTSRE